MPLAKLSLPDHPRTLVWQRLVQFAQANATLRRAIEPGSWLVWDGSPASAQPFASGMLPAIRMTPVGRGVTAQTPVRQSSPFGVQVDIAIDGMRITDLLNLWGAFELALFPGDGSNALLAALQKVYPETFDINLETPAITPQKTATDAEFLLASGILTVQMLIKK